MVLFVIQEPLCTERTCFRDGFVVSEFPGGVEIALDLYSSSGFGH